VPTRYLLDTNILSDLLKNPQGKVAPKDLLPFFRRTLLVRNKHYRCGQTSVGAAKSGSSILAGRMDQLLDAIEILPLEPKADRNYGRIHSQLEKVSL
jgi:tRNA(fMet)-specific endonuclease VapC